MSILIKGIDLPRNGDCHHITIYDNGDTYMTTSNRLYETDRKDVEAIQIPKGHGRLIDEREVKKAQFIINDQWGSYPVISLGNLNCVPTILEAEEVDEHNTERD